MLKQPKGLVYDVETGPNLGWVWGKWEQNVIQFEQEWQLLSFSYKWLGEKKTYVVGQDSVSEEALVLRVWQLFDESDFVIAHNGDKFDQKMMNVKFMEYGLTPPSPYKSIDTLKIAKRYFRFNSNKLDDLGQKLGVGKKAETGGFETWLGCLKGDKKAWAKMLKYNKQDVILLEKIYLALRPWMTNHPNFGDMLQTDHVCPKCTSSDLERRGTTHGRNGLRQRYMCRNCGGWSSEAKLRSDGRLVNA